MNADSMSNKRLHGPWRVEFCMPLTKHAGLYVSRMLSSNAKEWVLRNGKPRRFRSREEANAAIAMATWGAA